MLRFVTKHPWLTLGLLVAIACMLFGPSTVGAWIGSHGRSFVVGLWRFILALFNGAF
jgi:hypothetical protein